MQTLKFNTNRLVCRLLAVALVILTVPSAVLAVDGTWIQTSDGLWSAPSSWSGGNVADGANATANFNTLDIVEQVPPFYRAGIGLDGNRTIGNMIFGDTNTATPGAWEIYEPTVGSSRITLAGTTPTITVHPLGPIDTGTPPIIDDAVIRMGLAGTSGFTKAGNGVLTLNAPNTGNTNTITGGINVAAGTLRIMPTSTMPAQAYTLGAGARLDTPSVVNSMSVAAGGTSTYTSNGANTSASNVTAAGPGTTLNLNIANNGTTLSAGGDWSGFQALNVTGLNPAGVSFFRIMPNPTGGPTFFNTASFTNTALNLDNAQLLVRSNSQGNTIPIGALTGSATGVLAGGNSGSAARYDIGGLNTSTTYNGIINGAGGLSINKVGTGTLTLAGTFTANQSPALGNQPPARQGGVFRVTTGTMKFTGVSAIPGGPAANPTILTTIDVLPGATFDVSAAPSTFTTSTQQKIQGGGTILGNWNHAAGQINAGDVGAPTAANENNLSSAVTPTAGTLTFNGNLTIGGGNIIHDIALTPGPGNDLVQVNGTATLTSGKIIPNLLAGAPAAGQTYTVLNATGGITGPASNMTVDFPGRGTDPIPFITGNNLQYTTPAGGVITADLVWSGAPSNTWDVETSQGWTNNGSPDRFFNLDDVAFTEAAGNKTVNVSGVVRPTTLEINNTSAYTFSAPATGGAIADPGGGTLGLTKTGAGALNMNLNNTFTGPVSITGSTVNVAGFTGTGAGPMTLNNATYIATVSVSNSSLEIPTGTTTTIQLDGAAATGGAANIPTLTGGGTLNLTSTVNDKFFGTFASVDFTGTLNVAPSGAATDLGEIRIRGGQTNFANAVVNLTATGISNQAGAAADSVATLAFGEVHADALSNFTAFNGGSTPPDLIFEIGAKNTNSDIAGIIADGIGNGDASVASIRKVGSGTLTLTGVNTYGGFVRIDDGILSVTQPVVQATEVTTDDVYINGDGVFNLNFSGNDQVESLYVDFEPQAAGTYGRIGHPSATFKVPYITGDGVLEVMALGAAIGLQGDYNNDGSVDAADYTVWRDNVGQPGSTLFNRGIFNGNGPVAAIDYTTWKQNFGATSDGSGALGTVPEPASWLVAMMAFVACGVIRRR